MACAAVWVIPDVRNQADASGAAVTTRLMVVNRSVEAASVQFELIPSTGGAAPVPASFELPPGGAFVAVDAMKALWGDELRAGTLRITSAQDLFLTAANVRNGVSISATAMPVTRLELAPQQEDVVESVAAVQTAARATVLSVTALMPSSSMEVTVFDAEGNLLSTRAFDGINGETRVALADLIASELPLARVAVRVTSGRVLPVLLISTSDGGPVAYAPLTPITLSPTPIVLPGASALKVASTGGEAVDIRLQALTKEGAPVDAGASARIAVDRVIEVRDLPQGMLKIEASAPFLALDSEWLRSPLAAAGVGDILLLAAAGETTRLTLAAGPDGGAATLTLYDAAGSVLAQSSEPFTLGPLAWREATLEELFPGTATAAVRVEAVVAEGRVAAQSALAVDGSDARLFHAAQAASVATACPEPVIQFGAEVERVKPGEPAVLSWAVRNADGIVVSAAPGAPQPMRGSLTVTPGETTEYTLKAEGSCGAATAVVTVYVGAPVLAAVEPSSGRPGQEVRVTVANAPGWTGIEGIVWTLADGRTLAAEVVASDGASATVRVPLALESAAPARQWAGSARIHIDAAGAETQKLSFSILPLAPAGDSVAGFRQALDAIAAASAERLAALLAAGAPAASIDPLKKALDAEAAMLRKAFDDIATTGRAVVPLNAPSAAVPQPPTYTLTRQDLDLAWALFRSAQAEGGLALRDPLALASAARGRPEAADGDRWDILKDPTYRTCLEAKLNEVRAVLDRNVWDVLYSQLFEILSTLSDITGLDKIPMAAVTKTMLEVAAKPEYWCNLYPIKLSTFTARPTPNPIPGYEYRESGREGRNIGTELYATFVQVWTREEAVDALVASATKALLKLAAKKMEKMQENEKEAFSQSIKKMLDSAYQSAREQVNAVVTNFGLNRVSQDRLVYKANLDQVEPDPRRNKPRILKRESREIGLEGLYPDDARYGLSGLVNPEKPRGGTIPLRILRKPKHFYDPDSTSTYYEIKGRPPLFAYTPVSVISREKELTVDSYLLTSVSAKPATATPRMLISGDHAKPFGPLTLSASRSYDAENCRLGGPCSRSSLGTISAKQSGKDKYTISARFQSTGQRFPDAAQNSAAIGVSAYNPRIPGNKQHIRVTCTVESFNAGPNSVTAGRTSGRCAVFTSTLDGGTSNELQFSADFGATQKRTEVFDVPRGFVARIYLSGQGDGNGSATVTAVVELLDK